jgi:hypothetical protein
MTERACLEVDTLTIRIPMRLQRRGGRKLIMTPEGAPVSGLKPSRHETLVKALVRAHRWRRRIENGRAKSITDLAEQEGRHGRLCLPSAPAHLPGSGHRGSNPRRTAVTEPEARRDAGERALRMGGAASEVERS